MPETPTTQPDPAGSRWWLVLLPLILLLALGLRLQAAASTPLNGDETDQYRAALVFRAALGSADGQDAPAGPLRVNHPLLAVFLIQAPLATGFRSAFAVRLPFVVLSVVGLGFVYCLARLRFARAPALLGLLLLSVDQFHLIRSLTASEAVALAFVPVILYVFARAVMRDRPNLMAIVGLLIGVGYFGKEDVLLLTPALLLFLAARRSRHVWFRRKELYLGLVIAAGLVGVDVFFNLTGATHNLSRIADRTAGVGVTLRATSLYLGELLVRMVDDPVAFVWAQDRWSWEVPAMNWVAGLICLTAAVQAVGRRRDDLTALLVWTFWVVFIVASVVAPVHVFFELDLKKWAGMSVVPAAILAGDLLHRRARGWRLGSLLLAVLLGYLIGNGVRISRVRENVYSLPSEIIEMRGLVSTSPLPSGEGARMRRGRLLAGEGREGPAPAGCILPTARRSVAHWL